MGIAVNTSEAGSANYMLVTRLDGEFALLATAHVCAVWKTETGTRIVLISGGYITVKEDETAVIRSLVGESGSMSVPALLKDKPQGNKYKEKTDGTGRSRKSTTRDGKADKGKIASGGRRRRSQ